MGVKILYHLNNILEKYKLLDKVPVFATQDYADYLLKSKGIKTIWFIEEVEDKLIFIIPFALKRKYIFKKGYFLTGVNNIGINSIDSEKSFLEEVVEIIIKNHLCDWIQQPPTWALFNVVPSKSIYCGFGTYRINLENNSEIELFNKMYSSTRRIINKAINSNIVIKCGPELVDDCSKVFREAALKGNILPLKSEVTELLNNIPDSIKIYIAYHNNVPQSCIIFLLNKYCKYGSDGGSILSSAKGINDLLIWHAIKDAKQSGIKYFDFVGARLEPLPGSKLEGIQRFKKHFGGEFVRGYIWKLPVSHSKYLIYNLIIRAIFIISLKKYQGDIIDQELHYQNHSQ